MLDITVILPMQTPAQIAAVERELNQKRIAFNVEHDRSRRTSKYFLQKVVNKRVLPQQMKKALGVQ